MKKQNQSKIKMSEVKDLGMHYPTDRSKKKIRYCLAPCTECGDMFKADMASVKAGERKRCLSCRKNKTHGGTKTKLYRRWADMLGRCRRKKAKHYVHYGGRGISACREWEKYSVFRDWALANGYSDDLSLDRIDNDGNYEPSNCRWTTMTVQARNTRRLRADNTSGYRGVGRSGKGWKARVQMGKKRPSMGVYKTPIEAAASYDFFIFSNNLEHTKNFKPIDYVNHYLKGQL